MSLVDRLAQHAASAAPVPGAAAALLQSSLQRFRELGLPQARTDGWRQTSLRSLEKLTPDAATEDASAAEWVRADASWPGIRTLLRLLNGRGLRAAEHLPEGVQVRSWQDALADPPEWLWQSLQRGYGGVADSFAWLNTAGARDGALIELAAGTVVADPMRLLLAHGAGFAGLAQARVVLRLQAGASLCVVEDLAAMGEGGGLANLVIEAHLEPGARLDWVRVQATPDGQSLIARSRFELGEGASLRYFTADWGAALARHDLEVALNAPGAACELSGLSVLLGRRHVETRLALQHRAPDTRSATQWRSLADGRTRAVFGGLIQVEAGADGTDAQLKTTNLLLSPHAEIDAQPELVIHADEVACSHGATVGQLDERALFYLRSRGIAEADARQLLTFAFCQAQIGAWIAPLVRETLERELLARLPTRVMEG